jgi:endonuclease/exonuclease/phosphatase family metal-dependent hydrolase
MNLKVVEWNVNGHKGKTGRMCTKEFYNSILSEVTEPDVIVLTEYKEEKNHGEGIGKEIENGIEKELSDNGKYFFSSANDVMIALKKDRWENLELVNFDFEEMYPDLQSSQYPNLCIVKGTHENNTPVFIIGVRIKTSKESISKLPVKEQKNEYKNRWKQLESAFEIIEEKVSKDMKEDEEIPIILAGDFNNSRYLGDMNDLGKMVQKDYEGKLTKYYNLQLIKKAFLDHGYEYSLSTPLGNSNSVYSHMLRVPCKLDHIFVKNLKVTSVKYSTDKYQSDHRMLIADVESVK